MIDVQKISVPGGAMAVIPWEKYEQLLELSEELEDIKGFDTYKNQSEELLPLELVERLSNGENPIKVWRMHRHLTAKQLATACDITAAHLSQIENAKRKPSVKLVKKIAAHLELNVDDII